MSGRKLASIAIATVMASAGASIATVAHADDRETFERMCGDYQRMMDDDDDRMGMRERWHRWWSGDRRPRSGAARRFVAIDQNHDGTVSAEEASANVETVFLAMDANEDGVVLLDEFMAVRMGSGRGRNKEQQAKRQERKKARFADMDVDKDEKVTKAEFIEAGRQWFVSADKDKDGKITPWEFRAQHRIF